MWNENSQVYQLDFGGRVTQESAKNFQIEFRGKQVRILYSLIHVNEVFYSEVLRNSFNFDVFFLISDFFYIL